MGGVGQRVSPLHGKRCDNWRSFDICRPASELISDLKIAAERMKEGMVAGVNSCR